MLLNQIMLYFMTGGTEEKVKQAIKRRVSCGVEMEEVQPRVVEEVVRGGTQSLVSEDAGLAGDDLKAVEVPSEEPAVPKQIEEESKESENIIEQENQIETGLGRPSTSEQRSDVEIVDKEPGKVEERKRDNVEIVQMEPGENKESVPNMTPLSEAQAAEEEKVPEESCLEEKMEKLADGDQLAAVSDDKGAEVRQPDSICKPENAEDLERICRESENNSQQIEEIAKEEEAEEVNEDQSVMSYLDEDETLIQDVEKSDMVEEAEPRSGREVEVKVKVLPENNVDQVGMTSTSVTEQPGQGGESSRATCDEAAGNVNDSQENVEYVSIVDRMLGMSSKPQKYVEEQDKEAKEQNKTTKCDPKEDKHEVVTIVEPDTRQNRADQEESEVALPKQQVDMSSQQVGLKVAMDRVLREKSAAKEMSVPR